MRFAHFCGHIVENHAMIVHSNFADAARTLLSQTIFSLLCSRAIFTHCFSRAILTRSCSRGIVTRYFPVLISHTIFPHYCHARFSRIVFTRNFHALLSCAIFTRDIRRHCLVFASGAPGANAKKCSRIPPFCQLIISIYVNMLILYFHTQFSRAIFTHAFPTLLSRAIFTH